MPETQILGVCGLYCGACEHYFAYTAEGAHIRQTRQTDDSQIEECKGCRSNILTLSCSKCSIRECAAGKNVLHCGLCGEYPCDQLKQFQHDGRMHHIAILEPIRKQSGK